MPDSTGKLTTSDENVIKKWFTDNHIGKCPMCGSSKWNMAKQLTVLQPTDGKQKIAGQTIFTVNIECESCGVIQSMNAKKLGIL